MEGTTSLGDETVTGDATFEPTGVEGTTSLGNETVELITPVDVTGVEALAEVLGESALTFRLDAIFSVTGLSTTGNIGNVLVYGDIRIDASDTYSEVTASQTPNYSTVTPNQNPVWDEEAAMASTFTTNTGIEKPGVGEQSGTWGTTTNENFDIIDRALNGVTGIALTTNSDESTLHTDTDNGALTDGMFKVLQYTGTLDSAHTVTITPNTAAKVYLVFNNTSGSQNLIFSQGTGDDATIVPGETAWIYADGGAEDAIVRKVELSKLQRP